MNVEVTKLPESRVALKIELTAQEVEQALERTYKQLAQRFTIPGFRKGKAPRVVLERMVGQEMFLHEGTEEAVRWGYRKAIEQTNLTPIDEAEIQTGGDHDHVESGHDFQFEATVSVKPDVQLPDYHSIHLDQAVIEVTDDEVSALLHDLQERNATLEPVVRPSQYGDVVTMNLVARVEGNEVLNQDNFEFELRDERTDQPDSRFPGLSRELEGANRADIREISLSLPDTYSDPELAGKKMLLRILVKEIKRKVLPNLDDDFAQSISEFETLDEVRAALRANLALEKRYKADEQLVNEAVEAINSRTFVDIPPVLIEEEIDRMIDDMRRMFEQQHVSLNDYLSATGKGDDALRQEMREAATNNVKTSLVIGAVADAEHIDVSAREVDAALTEALRGGTMSETERRRLRTSNAVRSNIRNRLRRQRAIQKLVEIMTGGSEVSPEAAEVVADQTAAASEDTEETVAVEVGS